MQKKKVLVCLINFLIASLLGLALRYSFVGSIPINYRFLTHAHSHVAMLGWIYLMLFTLFVHYFVPGKKTVFNRLFWLTEFSVLGMMLSFPFQGYGAISISFSTLHIFCSYYFTYLIWKHHEIKNIPARYLLKASLLFMLLSTVGVWCLGPAVSLQGNASAFYQIAIQFFLHFQFQGWYLTAVLALFFYSIKLKDSENFRLFYKLLIASTLLTLALPVNWYAPSKLLYWINVIGVLIQLYSIVLFFKIVKPDLNTRFKQNSQLSNLLLAFAVFSLVLKAMLQLTSLSPVFSQSSHQYRNLVIGFIHLTMLGLVSGFLFYFIVRSKIILENRFLKAGIYCFVIGFIGSEFLLMMQGSMFYFGSGSIPNYYLFLFGFSGLIPIAIIILISNILKRKTAESS
ncbi:hypothetical protein [Lutimonas sp.]|uniref:hypothetical protein n=1 Tax=Lutimonas sp. TaxID=1872403 RepID=UPI003D9B0468